MYSYFTVVEFFLCNGCVCVLVYNNNNVLYCVYVYMVWLFLTVCGALYLELCIIVYFALAQVKGVMRQNIEKVAQRGEKLEDLGERAGEGQEHDICHQNKVIWLTM